jgi:hypothetical protein
MAMRNAQPESRGPGEFIFFALEFLPDELWLIALVIGVVFALVWIAREVFRICFST